jgi:hypothetical protein
VSHLRSLPKVALAAALVLVAAACTSAAADGPSAGTTATTATSGKDASLLYVERADGGRFEPVNAQRRLYDLHLRGAEAEALYFTDRPARRAGEVAFKDTLDELGVMKGRDTQSPPNATLVINGAASVPLEIRHLVTAGDSNTTLQVRLLERGAYAKNGKQVDLPARFGKASLFIDDGTSLGYTSVQVAITNDTWGSLIVEGPNIDPGAAWASGETPTPGQSLPQYSAAQFGVMTNDVDGSAGGQFMLTGLGSYPVTVTFANTSNGVSNALVDGNDAVQAIITQLDTGEQNHTLYQVQLVPV